MGADCKMIPLRPYQQELVDNIRLALREGKHSVCAVLGCGGGKSVIQGNIAAAATARKNRVLFIVHRKELCQQITNTFAACGVDFDYCTVGMVQTVCRRLAKTEAPKLILVDEAHHILSQSYISILQHFPSAVVLGFTATPQRMNEGGLGAVFEQLIESVSTEWLISNHYLAPYKYYGVQLADTSKLHTKHGDYDKAEVEQLMNKRAIFGSAVENWLRLAKGKQTIVYCSSIATSQGTAIAFQEHGIAAVHLDGETPQVARQAAVDSFRHGKIQVLCNVDLFGEGFDVPDCECVILMRPTKSLTLHIQQSMRSMRTSPNNPDKVALILDHVGNFTRHGLPDDVREWTLEAKAKKKKAELSVKQCPVCFAVVKSAVKECPMCKYVWEKEEREGPEVIEDIMLQEVAKLPYAAHTECHTFAELDLFRRTHKRADGQNYKFAWVLHKAVQLNVPVPLKYRAAAVRMLSQAEFRRLQFE